jgi:hypothetical protein
MPLPADARMRSFRACMPVHNFKPVQKPTRLEIFKRESSHTYAAVRMLCQ